MEAPGVSQFRSYVLTGRWAEAESSLPSLGVDDEERLRVGSIRFLYTLKDASTFLLGFSTSYNSAEVSGTFGDAERECRPARTSK